MSTLVTRSFPLLDLAIRAGGDGRTVEAYAAVWDTQTEIRDNQGHYLEQIVRTAFNKTIADRGDKPWPVMFNHGLTSHGTPSDRFMSPIGVSVERPRVDGYGLRTVSHYFPGERGDEVLDNINSHAIDSQSFRGTWKESFPATPRGGYRPMRDGSLPSVTRTQVAMLEYGPAIFAAYPTASIVGVRASLTADEQALAQQLLTALAVADAGLDPIVDALCAADGALDAAQAVIASILAVPNPDPADGADEMDDDPAAMSSANLTSLAVRLDAAITARASATPIGAGTDGPLTHPGRLIVARNNLRAALIQRGIKA